nr:MAG TPA: hypothetical protein [Caudoviricetes sp.]
MSIKIISAKITPNPVSAGAGYLISIGIEDYGILKEASGATLFDNNGVELHTADKRDYTIPYTSVQIDQAIGGLLTWKTT